MFVDQSDALPCPTDWAEWIGSFASLDVLYSLGFYTLIMIANSANALLICLGVGATRLYERRLSISFAWMLLLVAVCTLIVPFWFPSVLLYMIPYPIAFAYWPWVKRRRTIFVLAFTLALLPLWIWQPVDVGWHASHLLFLWMWPWLERHRNWLLFFAVGCFTPVFAPYDLNYWWAFWPLFSAFPGYLADLSEWCLFVQAFPFVSFPSMILVLLITYGLWKKFSRFGDPGNAQRDSKAAS